MDEVFVVAMAAGDWGGQDAGRPETEVEGRPQHIRHRLGTQRGVTHDSLANAPAARRVFLEGS